MKKTLLAILAFSTLSAAQIQPITREMGSGTRSAFVEIFKITKELRGKKVDSISKNAEVTNSTGVMIASIEGAPDSIGYISLGSLKDSVKALKIDGVAPSIANIIDKSYKISRPFNVVLNKKSALTDDFLDYTASSAASEVIQKAGYIALSKNNFSSKKPSGKLVIAGSSSIAPLMEKLIENYATLNPGAKIELLQSDSTTGVNSVIEGIADIGMVSREVKQSELDKGVKPQILAIDGLAVIVNKKNALENISSESVRKIFGGEIKKWEEVK